MQFVCFCSVCLPFCVYYIYRGNDSTYIISLAFNVFTIVHYRCIFTDLRNVLVSFLQLNRCAQIQYDKNVIITIIIN